MTWNDILRRLFVMLAGLGLAVVTGIVVAIYGWGLTPRNWGVIIGVGVGGHLCAQALIALGKEEKKP